ncbi:MAG: mechanosensitive ion channel family protein [Alphaproteobacteria bacterium]|nr:mechanosensitive ion channel family protein [Alphaproteobacteria bacterium]
MDWNWTDLLYQGLYAVIVCGVGYLAAGWLTGLANMAIGRTPLDPIVRRLVVSLVRPVVLGITVFAALSLVGIPITTFAAMAGAVTLAVGMAMQGSLSNVASGALLLSLRPFNANDVITAAGHTGKVRSLKLFATTLETPDGNTITLPNDVVFKGPITTYTTTPNGRIDLTWVVKPDTDLDKAAKIIDEALAGDERTLEDPPPSLTYAGVTELGIELVGRAWTPNDDKLVAKSAIHAVVLKGFQKAKIQLATRGV